MFMYAHAKLLTTHMMHLTSFSSFQYESNPHSQSFFNQVKVNCTESQKSTDGNSGTKKTKEKVSTRSYEF